MVKTRALFLDLTPEQIHTSVLGRRAGSINDFLGPGDPMSSARSVLGFALVLLVLSCRGPDGARTAPDMNVNAVVDAAPELAPDTGPTEPPGCLHYGTPGATARCLQPTRSPDYYVDQAHLYFDTLDVDAPPDNVPDYGEWVARWEWPPWLLLTGLGKADMIEVAKGLKVLDPSTVPVRDCRFFPLQPFARCRVEFLYDNGPCPIYEEFTFNAAGQMTFIEAWSDLPGLAPQGTDDPWAEAPDFPRLATRIPGLGTPAGALDLHNEWLLTAAAEDAELADFALRASDWWTWWMEALTNADADYFAKGCGW